MLPISAPTFPQKFNTSDQQSCSPKKDTSSALHTCSDSQSEGDDSQIYHSRDKEIEFFAGDSEGSDKGLVLFSQLPAELKRKIVEFLDPTDFKTFRASCQEFYEIGAGVVRKVIFDNPDDIDKLETYPGVNVVIFRGSDFRDEHLQLLESSSSIRSITFDHCTNITGEGIAQILGKFPRLTTLNLPMCRQITDAGMTEIAHHIPALTELNLAGCYQITGVGINELTRHIPTLTGLNFAESSHIDNEVINAIARRIPTLATLNLAYCDRITDEGIIEFAGHAPALTFLNLIGCPHITHASANAFGSHVDVHWATSLGMAYLGL